MEKTDKGQGLAGFIISTAMSFVVLLLLTFVTPSCRTHKQTSVTTSENVERLDTSIVANDFHSTDWRRLLLSWAADSMTIRLCCDSIVKPDGTTLYAPSIETEASSPHFAVTDDVVTDRAGSSREESSSSISADKGTATDSTSELVVVTKPPDLWGLFTVVILAAVAAFLAWRTIRKFSKFSI